MIRVIKVGGSLLDLPDLRRRFERWHAIQTEASVDLLVCGGGKLVDAMRAYDAVHQLNVKEVHWQCVDLLSLTSVLLQRLLAVENLLTSPTALQQFIGGCRGKAIVTPSAYYLHGTELCPTDWRTTTDTLAAVLATRVNAQQLVLLKSSGSSKSFRSPEQEELQQLVRDELVDEAFPCFASQIPDLKIVNLRGG